MVGDYNDDSSVKENLNLLLCLTTDRGKRRLETVKIKGFLKDFFKSQGYWGLSQ